MATDSTGRDRKGARVAKHKTRPKLDTQTATLMLLLNTLLCKNEFVSSLIVALDMIVGLEF